MPEFIGKYNWLVECLSTSLVTLIRLQSDVFREWLNKLLYSMYRKKRNTRSATGAGRPLYGIAAASEMRASVMFYGNPHQ